MEGTNQKFFRKVIIGKKNKKKTYIHTFIRIIYRKQPGKKLHDVPQNPVKH